MLPAGIEQACGIRDRVKPAKPDNGGIRNRWVEILAEAAGVATIALLAVLVGQSMLTRQVPAVQSSDRPPLDPGPCVADPEGAYLSGRLYGGIELGIDWRGETLACAGMLRPAGQGIRLIFASAPDGSTADITFVLGIDAELDAPTGTEQAANITVIDRGSGRFFSSAGMARCWTILHEVEALTETTPHIYRVNGEAYCAGALPALSGPGSVTLSDFQYSGQVTLDDSTS
jgi:hypothetical protein